MRKRRERFCCRRSWCFPDGFEGVDEPVEVVVDVAVVGGETKLSVGFGGGDEDSGFVSLTAVDVDERRRRARLEVGAGQTCVGVRAALLGWPSAVAVGQAGLNPGDVGLVHSASAVTPTGSELMCSRARLTRLLAVLVERPPGRWCRAGWRSERQTDASFSREVARQPNTRLLLEFDDVTGGQHGRPATAEQIAHLITFAKRLPGDSMRRSSCIVGEESVGHRSAWFGIYAARGFAVSDAWN